MTSNLILSVAVTLAAMALVSGTPRQAEVSGVRLASRLPELVHCNYTETPGASCFDCRHKLICTPIGGVISSCWLPGPYCVHGSCSRSPSDDCLPPTLPTPPPSTEQEPPTSEAWTDDYKIPDEQ